MARLATRNLSWQSIFIASFIILCTFLLFGNSLFVWKQTTIMITTNNPSIYDSESNDKVLLKGQNETKESAKQIDDETVYLQQPSETTESMQSQFNLHRNPYDNIPRSAYLQSVSQSDYLSFGECLSSINKENSKRVKCSLSDRISFDILDVIGSGNHGQIFSAHIDFKMSEHIPLNINLDLLSKTKYAIKHSRDNETCTILQFENNIMRHIESANSIKTFHMPNLHPLVPWIEFVESNRFTRQKERKCLLVMEQIENIKTFEGLIRKNYAPTFEYDNGLIPFLIDCYNDLMSALQRLWLFDYYHIDINGVNILVDHYNISSQRKCYLIDFGGVFSLNFDAKTDKLFTGKSHNYSPFAYYNLYLFQLRKRTNWNATLLRHFARRDNEYRIIVELMRFFLEYADLEKDGPYSDEQWKFIEDAKDKQSEFEHVKPFGIEPNNQTYIQLIWCLRQAQIKNIRQSKLGTIGKAKYTQKQKNEFLILLTILENGVRETNSIDKTLCAKLMS